MQLVAYYIHSSEFGVENKTVNFGGHYFYSLLENSNGNIEIARSENCKYIEHFYSKSQSLKEISAIVGRNGTGKTSLIIDMIECISGYRNSLNILVFERNQEVLLFFGNSDRSIGQIGNKKWKFEPNRNFNIEILKSNIGSIYYSPHLDNRTGLPGIDLSFDRILYRDLEEIEGLTYHTNTLNPIKQHEFRNFKRQMQLIGSDIYTSLFQQFNLPKLSKIKLSFSYVQRVFTTVSREFTFHNTPTQFRKIFNEILRKTEEEKSGHRSKKLITLQKVLMKHYILIDLLSVLIDVAERRNTFLEEGYLPNDFQEMINGLNAIDTFYYFIDNHHYVTPRAKNQKQGRLSTTPIPKNETKYLLEKLFSIIDDLKAVDENDDVEFDWHNKCIYPSLLNSYELLKLSTRFSDQLKYYYQGTRKSRADETEVSSFINFEWFDRIPSSGENVILNLFSRLLEIRNKVLKSEVSYYILFLDEGDAGFHPEWKKRFIEIISEITPLLFDKVDVQFQIIFTTHDPLTLSDILNYNIVYLGEKNDNAFNIFEFESGVRPRNSFAANISDLLSDSFFIGDGLIGNFSKKKIREAIEWLNNKSDLDGSDYYKILIKNIDEPIVQRKLSEMYDEKLSTNIQVEIIESQIKKLQDQKAKLL